MTPPDSTRVTGIKLIWKILKGPLKSLFILFIGIMIGLYGNGQIQNYNHYFAGDHGIVHFTDYKVSELKKDIPIFFNLPINENYTVIVENNWKKKQRTLIDIDTKPHENGFFFNCFYENKDTYKSCDDGFEVESSTVIRYNFDLKTAKKPKYELCITAEEYTNSKNFYVSCMDIYIPAESESLTNST